ncbi:hypothetical protein [Xanthomonas sacchari]|nr:hypothetical protein [Xanthomonas sacchari]
MVSVDRAAITNAIWLCANCHKLVDDDEARFPAGLLFEWQKEHERRVAEQLGKVAAEVRQRFEKRQLEEFGRLSFLAERIITEKGEYWEYQLTAEVLRYEISPILRRWRALQSGLYVKPLHKIEVDLFSEWFSGRMEEILQIVDAFTGLANNEVQRAWGKPHEPGNDMDIVSACRLFAEVCSATLAWEESVRFARCDNVFEELREKLIGIAGDMIEQTARIPLFISEIFSGDVTPGTRELVLEVTLPGGWLESVNLAMHRVKDKIRF